MNLNDIFTVVDGEHQTQWSILVPIVLKRVAEVAAQENPGPPDELVVPKEKIQGRMNPTESAWRHLDRLKTIDLSLATAKRTEANAAARAECLEFLRSWATRALKNTVKGDLRIRFVHDEKQEAFRQ